jgi:hypothetical protein
MNKDAAVSLSAKVLGLATAAYALYCLFTFLVNVLAIGASSTELEGVTIRLPNLRWDPLAKAVLFGAVSAYFLIGGNAVRKWLLRGFGDEKP